FLCLVFISHVPAALGMQAASESMLASVRRSDASNRDAKGKLQKLPPAEHMRRAAVYLSVRAFAEARDHWQTLIENYPDDQRVPEAMLGIGRSYFLGKIYQDGYRVFNELVEKYASTKEGREALNYSAASLLRMGRFDESAARYTEYVERFPNGERIDTAHLNVIDTLREADRPAEALAWVNRTRSRFAGTAVETNAIFAALRLYIAEENWSEAIRTGEELSKRSFSKAVDTSRFEVAYLTAFSLEQAGRKDEAFATYLNIGDGTQSYYGWLATLRLKALAGGNGNRGELVAQREIAVKSAIAAIEDSYPAPYRQSILAAAKARKLDPRFILALIKQESVFKPTAKSPAGARGLLQLTMDAAVKYGPKAGFRSVSENQLYQPETSITVGAEYLEHLTDMFPKMLEPVAASYNGGEDNVARWLKRSKRHDPGVFTAEVGFDETKGYVQKVMANYRIYRELYTSDLIRK
ncbi:MAG TPA: transglycosylase SLT domain-containing protein, partial [Pyrinomonadaceae bacterium]|nr:transglycosylase SLT domain-containing protein [Pyrinomonadaceae bacterium]